MIFIMIIVAQLNVAFLALQSTIYQVPIDGWLIGFSLNLSTYSDGGAANQSKLGLFPSSPTALTFTDNVSPCYGLLGCNATATAGVPINLVHYFPVGVRVARGQFLYLSGTQTQALPGAGYATLRFSEAKTSLWDPE
jgi:hypothetical protein